ncbi:MAG: translocation/assembly module TamB domain-containing protein, partial [Candidatus Eiseniibacteriota bacterium]
VQLAARLTGDASAGDARLYTIAAECDMKDGVVRVPRLALRGNLLTANGAGRIALPGSIAAESTMFHVEGTLGAVDPLAALFGLTTLNAPDGRFRLSATGPAGATAIACDASVRRPHINDIWADSVALHVTGLTRDDTLTNLRTRIDARSLVVWPLVPRDLAADFAWNGRELSAEVRSLRAGKQHEEIAFHLEPRDRGLRGRLDRLVLDRPDGKIALESPVDFELGTKLFLGDLVLLDNGAPMLRAHATVEEAGPVDVAVHLNAAEWTYLREILGLSAIGGSLVLDGSLTGTRSRPIADVTLKAQVIAGSRQPAAIHGRLQWADGVFDLSTKFDQTSSNRMTLTARLPLTLSLASGTHSSPVTRNDGSMQAELVAHRFDLSWFEPWISPRTARDLKGWVDGTVKAGGDPDHPSLSGRLALADGAVRLPHLGVNFKDGEATIGLDGRTVTLERATLKSGGTVTAQGTAAFEGPGRRSVDLDVKVQRFVPVNTAQAKVELSGEIHASGKLGTPRVQGDLTVQKSTFYAEKGEATKLEPVTLSQRDLLDLQERFGVGVGAPTKRGLSLADSADLDVSVKIGDNVWVRRRSDPIVALELQGDVRVRRPPGAAPDVRGTLGIRTGRSYLSFLGRRFEMQAARVGLPGPADSASVHLEAFYAPRANGTSSTDITVNAIVEIDPSGAVTDLQSEPYLDRASLLNYLATGEVQGGMGSGTAYGLA